MPPKPAPPPLPVNRHPDMTELEWLVALEEIRQLKARRDRYADAQDWDAYAALYAPDHVSDHPPDPKMGMEPEPWTSRDEMMANIIRLMGASQDYSAHHSYDAEIRFETPTRAHAIWAMTDGGVYPKEDGSTGWMIQYGYYYETCEKRGHEWLFTYRRWERYMGIDDRGGAGAGINVFVPRERLKGADAFDVFPRL